MQVDLSSDDIRSDGDADRDTISNVENLTGSDHDDTLTGNELGNVLVGGAGADTLDGGAGNDTASYAGSDAGVTVSIAVADRDATGGDAAGGRDCR